MAPHPVACAERARTTLAARPSTQRRDGVIRVLNERARNIAKQRTGIVKRAPGRLVPSAAAKAKVDASVASGKKPIVHGAKSVASAKSAKSVEMERSADRVASAPGATTATPTTAPPAPRRCADATVNLLKVAREAAYTIEERPTPTVHELGAAFGTNVFFSDEDGVGTWGAEYKAWQRPEGWLRLIERFNQMSHDVNLTKSMNMHTCCGEYNRIFLPLDAHHEGLPPLRTRAGTPVAHHDVVFRVTRPDRRHGGCYRYKTLASTIAEMRYTLHAARHGLAPICYAVVLFYGVTAYDSDSDAHAQKLFGALYVMQRGEANLHDFLLAKVEQTRLSVDKSEGSPEETVSRLLHRVGRLAARKVLPVISRQAKLGIINFDSKPTNIVVGDRGQPYAIDFDTGMYAIRAGCGNAVQWAANLLVNLTLLTAHVRRFCNLDVARGWAAAVRPLVLELVVAARGCAWLLAAKALPYDEFVELRGSSDDVCRRRFEMITALYFGHVDGGRLLQPLQPHGSKEPAPLLHRLVRYVLTGSTVATDDAVEATFGDQAAHARQARAVRPAQAG